MFVSTREITSGFEFIWSLQLMKPQNVGQLQMLDLQYEIEALEELYIGDRLWTYDQNGHRCTEPNGVYRFIHRDDLRFVFAPSPLPPNAEYRNVYAPLFTRLNAGEKLKKHLRLAVPIDEYSAFARDIDEPTAIEYASTVTLVMTYKLRSTLTKDPAPPLFESPETAGYIVQDSEMLISSMQVEPLPVKRRQNQIPRFMIPGDLPS